MPCVLIVEDEPDVREMMRLLLENVGYTTMTATNGLEALELMRSRLPCLVLLDLMMPVMSGWEFREEQLRDPQLAKIPVVCVTAMFTRDEVLARLHLRCLQKPLEFDELFDVIQSECGLPVKATT